jgi:hypothetical protein
VLPALVLFEVAVVEASVHAPSNSTIAAPATSNRLMCDMVRVLPRSEQER